MYKLIVLICIVSNVFAFPGLEDEVIILPGLQFQPTFKHYSGYLNGSDTRKLHYWFVESQKSPKTDPLVLWLNGGPGCSSLDGLLTEHGPFRVMPEGYLTYNEYSWNKIANVIYLESPSCVGFSYSTDGNCDATDDTTSLQNYNALKHFLIKFPQFKNRDFYITGESYGGFYVPTLSERIALSPGGLPVVFKGIAVGNGLSSWVFNDNGNFNFAYNHGLISDSLWSEILSACCKGGNSRNCDITSNKDSECVSKVSQAKSGYGNLNPYNIYSDCSDSLFGTDKKIWSYLNVNSNYEKSQILFGWNADPEHRLSKLREQYKIMNTFLSRFGLSRKFSGLIPCSNDTATADYLNKPRVRLALHISKDAPVWTVCSGNAMVHYVTIYKNMTSQYKNLFKLKDFKIWIYNGDIDMMCSYLADEWFFESLNQHVVSERRPWYYTDVNASKQVGGYVKVWDKFVLLTIRGAGHMVPTDKPLPAYHMFESFINGTVL